jgi:hypothetical protein
MGAYGDPRGGQPNRGSYGSVMPARSSVPARPAVGRPTPNMTGKRVLRVEKPNDKSLTDQLVYTNM